MCYRYSSWFIPHPGGRPEAESITKGFSAQNTRSQSVFEHMADMKTDVGLDPLILLIIEQRPSVLASYQRTYQRPM